MTTKEEQIEIKKQRETVEEIARHIAMLSRQVSALLAGRLKTETIVITFLLTVECLTTFVQVYMAQFMKRI